ncbi:uncharacterized protein LOC132281447 [Cornus florida]|uniref:uncharacterized protein LOC132281447 n=1 Tax=Cornus florida TaxID=4283 RepID=UPI00289A6541|nr:uncharacterized protein LOC132281447 [Cornus florida]
MYIRGRGKIGYLMGDKKAPASEDPTYVTWDAENSMVMTWLVNSMDEDISSNYMCYSTAKELWDNVNQMYFDLGNQSQIYELTLKLGEIRTPLPPIGEVFVEVRREESRRHVMLGKKTTSGPVESSALIVAEIAANKAVNFQRKPEEKPRVWCDFCNKPRHTQENCWKIHDKPANWKSSKPGDRNRRAVPTANEAETGPLSKEQMNHLLKLLKLNSSSGIPNVSLAQIGSALNALSCCLNYTPWIIDSGASDHMTSLSNLFSTYSPCFGLEKIRIADGSFSPIAGKGLIKLSENINLQSVLHIPKLAYNLLSDRSSRKKIGSAKIIDGLYYFDGDFSSNKKAQGLSSVWIVHRSIVKVVAYLRVIGENEVMEENFLDLSPTPLPNVILTPSPYLTVIPKIQSQEQCDKTNENNEENLSYIVPNIIVSETGEESLQPGIKVPNTEPLVYTRRILHQKSQSQPIPLGIDQSQSPGTGLLDIIGNSDPNSSSVPIASPTQEPSDLDIPIAFTKGIRIKYSNPKYPIAKYLSYKKLSHTHRAFA